MIPPPIGSDTWLLIIALALIIGSCLTVVVMA